MDRFKLLRRQVFFFQGWDVPSGLSTELVSFSLFYLSINNTKGPIKTLLPQTLSVLINVFQSLLQRKLLTKLICLHTKKTDWYNRERNFFNLVLQETESAVSEHTQHSVTLCTSTSKCLSISKGMCQQPCTSPSATASTPAVHWGSCWRHLQALLWNANYY